MISVDYLFDPPARNVDFEIVAVFDYHIVVSNGTLDNRHAFSLLSRNSHFLTVKVTLPCRRILNRTVAVVSPALLASLTKI